MTTRDLLPTMAVFAARVCRLVVDEGEIMVDAIEDRIGLSTPTCKALLTRLCDDKILKRNQDYVSVADLVKAAALAEQGKPAVKEVAKVLLPLAKRSARPAVVFDIGTTIAIDKGIPVPPRPGRDKAARPWPFAQMAVGDSFQVPIEDGVSPEGLSGVLHRHTAEFARANAGYKFTLRVAADRKSVRVWREALDTKPEATPATGSLGMRTRARNGK